MTKYSRIVVGSDGSDSAAVAVRQAAAVAAAFDAELFIVTVYHGESSSLLSTRTADVSSLPVVSEERAEEYLQQSERIAREEGATKINLIARSGSPVQILTGVVTDEKADFIVVGNKGVNTITGRVFGNVPTEVTRRANVDVMLVNTASAS